MAKLKPDQFYLGGHLITELPILFQTELVRANLEDRKTQTRRTIGLNQFNVDPNFWNREGDPRKSINRLYDGSKEVSPNPIEIQFGFREPLGNITYIRSRYGKPGDLLWVRETWQSRSGKALKMGFEKFFFKAGWEGCTDGGWKPSIHMPKSAARLWLMVEDIRVERLQDIIEKDAKAEGVFSSIPSSDMKYVGQSKFVIPRPFLEHQFAFMVIWCKINGWKSWDANPWVWVVQYRILSKTGRPNDQTILTNHLQITGKEATDA